ncbi:hypothetical protein [Streptomyces sp. NRRL S-337]|uniref:hypothetical protein n=1 Tax=Streptomyces sp. NRRL S-337 TaxID=1463900 RepID=UPI000A832262|nr:hypothetical protein [Streptomyces sp. NRRL S-337]
MTYLSTFAQKIGEERLDAEFAKVIKGSNIAPPSPEALRDGRKPADQGKRVTPAGTRGWRHRPGWRRSRRTTASSLRGV